VALPVGGSALDFRFCRFGGTKPPVFRLGHRGDFFANKAVELSILASFYISILISLSVHADFSVWALFFFCSQ
jgi:hypothetical protein